MAPFTSVGVAGRPLVTVAKPNGAIVQMKFLSGWQLARPYMLGLETGRL